MAASPGSPERSPADQPPRPIRLPDDLGNQLYGLARAVRSRFVLLNYQPARSHSIRSETG
uniref:Uncharacterized protein n=1 Tax=Oryza meridionalis TaxID=40149 RepID=A0A0E0ERH9_9ORYZ